jgi:hypothetical protein
MNTTSFVIELLLAGVGCLLWLVLVALRFIGREELVGLLSSVDPAATVAASVALAYLLGVIVDRVYLPVWNLFDSRHRDRAGLTLDSYYAIQLQSVLKNNEQLSDHLNYYTSRLRILRASAINFTIVAIMAGLSLQPELARAVRWGSIFVAGGSAVALWQLTAKYYAKLVILRPMLDRTIPDA